MSLVHALFHFLSRDQKLSHVSTWFQMRYLLPFNPFHEGKNSSMKPKRIFTGKTIAQKFNLLLACLVLLLCIERHQNRIQILILKGPSMGKMMLHYTVVMCSFVYWSANRNRLFKVYWSENLIDSPVVQWVAPAIRLGKLAKPEDNVFYSGWITFYNIILNFFILLARAIKLSFLKMEI